MWIICIVTGGILTALLGSFFRANPFQLPIWELLLVTLPFSTYAQFAFAVAFSQAPVFFVAWFTGSAVCAISAFLFSRLLFGEIMQTLDFLAAALILVGAALLSRPH